MRAELVPRLEARLATAFQDYKTSLPKFVLSMGANVLEQNFHLEHYYDILADSTPSTSLAATALVRGGSAGDAMTVECGDVFASPKKRTRMTIMTRMCQLPSEVLRSCRLMTKFKQQM